MSRSIQLVLLCVVTLSYIQLGRAQCDVDTISRKVLQVLLPIMNDIKDDMNSLKENMIDLSEDFNSVKGELTSLNETVSHLSGDLEQHKNQTASVLADLQSSINRSSEELRHVEDRLVNRIENLDTKLTSVDNTLMRGDLSSVKRELTSFNESMNRICDKMEEHEDHMTTEIMELEEFLQRNFTRLSTKSYGYAISPPIHTCGGTGGWRHAVYLDMTDPNTNCPEGWNMTDYSKRTCGRATDGHYTCDSVTFSVSGGEYSQVCGRMRAYQWGYTSGFSGYRIGKTTVDEAYFTGVAVMHGSPRQHIWSFVAGLAENYPEVTGTNLCPCDSFRYEIPPFVGEDHFCESGYIYPGLWNPYEVYRLHSDDTLWDGMDCHSNSTCCSRRNPPYFTKTFNTPTTDDIELRMCFHYPITHTNVAVEVVELYVK